MGAVTEGLVLGLAAAAQGWAFRRTTRAERVLLLLGGAVLCFPSLFGALAASLWGGGSGFTATIGLLLAVLALLKQWLLPAPPEARLSS